MAMHRLTSTPFRWGMILGGETRRLRVSKSRLVAWMRGRHSHGDVGGNMTAPHSGGERGECAACELKVGNNQW